MTENELATIAVDNVGFRADIIMENKLIVEIKSVEYLEKTHRKIYGQLL